MMECWLCAGSRIGRGGGGFPGPVAAAWRGLEPALPGFSRLKEMGQSGEAGPVPGHGRVGCLCGRQKALKSTCLCLTLPERFRTRHGVEAAHFELGNSPIGIGEKEINLVLLMTPRGRVPRRQQRRIQKEEGQPGGCASASFLGEEKEFPFFCSASSSVLTLAGSHRRKRVPFLHRGAPLPPRQAFSSPGRKEELRAIWTVRRGQRGLRSPCPPG